MSVVGNNLKNMRLLKGMSQTELSKISGVSLPYLNRIEKGIHENPSLDFLSKLARGLNCTVEDLTGDIENCPPEKSASKTINQIIEITKANTKQASVSGLILERLVSEKIIDENFTITPKLKKLLEDAIRLDAELNNNLKKA